MWPKKRTAFLVIHGIGEQNPAFHILNIGLMRRCMLILVISFLKRIEEWGYY